MKYTYSELILKLDLKKKEKKEKASPFGTLVNPAWMVIQRNSQ